MKNNYNQYSLINNFAFYLYISAINLWAMIFFLLAALYSLMWCRCRCRLSSQAKCQGNSGILVEYFPSTAR
jgi:hypothetical protein